MVDNCIVRLTIYFSVLDLLTIMYESVTSERYPALEPPAFTTTVDHIWYTVYNIGTPYNMLEYECQCALKALPALDNQFNLVRHY